MKRVGACWALGQVLLAVGSALVTTQAYPLELPLLPKETLTRLVSPGNTPLHNERLVAQAVASQATMAPRRFSQGEVLYIRHCSGCHGWEGKGDGPVGQVLVKKPPSLRRPELFAQNTEAELVVRILLGKDLSVPLATDAVKDTDAEVSALVAYLRRLPTIPWKEVVAGQAIYDSLCVSCHGIYGRGDGLMSPSLSPHPRDLTDPTYQKRVSDEDLFRIISKGRGAMPSSADVSSAEERRAVIAFIRLLSPGYELYDRFCEVCHGAMGVPPEAAQKELFGETQGDATPQQKTPVFNQKYLQSHTDGQLRGWVRHMLKQNRAVMPHFSGALNAEEVRQILAYLHSLPPPS
ncbi:MAG: c-type cytochrome [Deltaproteobacteria bacterium]|nr:c-type cytochrome [Deltaproteobacteria bacterium]